MFKKPVTSAAASLLSGKDLKRLKATLEKCYTQLTEDDIRLLLPSKAEVTQAKLSNKAIIYCVNGPIPLFFDSDGRGDFLLPTVYALWIAPTMLPRIFTHSQVSPKVLGGADLFLQGVIVPSTGLPTFVTGDVCSIAIPDNPYPFAVVAAQVDSAAAQACGMKGKGFKLLHCFGDMLWQLGDSSRPDASFTAERIYPMQQAQEVAVTIDAVAQDVAGLSVDTLSNSQPAASGEATTDVSAEAGATAAPAPSTAAEEEAAEEAAPAGDGQSMDQLVEQSLLAGLVAVPDSALPLLTSDFYAKYMLPNRPQGCSIDIKKSSYKKLGKLLSTYEKIGVLKQKVVHKQENLSHVHRNHELLQGLQVATPVASAGGAAANSNGKAAGGKVDISWWYRVPSSLRPLFTTQGPIGNKDVMFNEQEVTAHLTSYAQHYNLLQSDGGTVKLDTFLASNLYHKKDGVMLDDCVLVSKLVEQALPRMQKFVRVTRATQAGETVEVLTKGELKRIKINVEDRQGGRKHLTKVVGVEGFAVDPDELATLLQRKFAASCSVTKLPGKTETNKEIAAQGALGKEIAAYLGTEFGIGSEHVEVHQKGK